MIGTHPGTRGAGPAGLVAGGGVDGFGGDDPGTDLLPVGRSAGSSTGR